MAPDEVDGVVPDRVFGVAPDGVDGVAPEVFSCWSVTLTLLLSETELVICVCDTNNWL